VPKKQPAAVPERTRTPRAAVREALDGPALSARQISERAGVPENDVALHLEHLDRSIRREGGRLVVEPASCLACGFVFRSRQRLSTPGSCPSCRSERIAPATFRIEAREGAG
jgi:predicted Zn-ribbon and HTH transcriptional regulator